MENMGFNKMIFDSIKEEKDNSSTNMKQDVGNFLAKPSSSITDENEFDGTIVPRDQNMQERGYHHATDTGKRMKPVENGISNFLKLKGFFEMVQKQHPESHLELQQVEGNWRVWCGVCKKHLRPDKSGKAIHNIQRQHFTSVRHQKKLNQTLQVEDEVQGENQNALAKVGGIQDVEHQDVKTENETVASGFTCIEYNPNKVD